MVKNYLFYVLRKIGHWTLTNRNNEHNYEYYSEMQKISEASYRKFLGDNFEVFLLRAPIHNSYFGQISVWYALKELWYTEKCNILYAGSDTLMVKPNHIFSKYDNYTAFNHYNDDIRYYPHTMSHESWDYGERLLSEADKHPDKYWGFDQDRNLSMAKDTGTVDNIAFQMVNGSRAYRKTTIDDFEDWEKESFKNATFLHFHASRGPMETLESMKNWTNKLEINHGTNTSTST